MLLKMMQVHIILESLIFLTLNQNLKMLKHKRLHEKNVNIQIDSLQ